MGLVIKVIALAPPKWTAIALPPSGPMWRPVWFQADVAEDVPAALQAELIELLGETLPSYELVDRDGRPWTSHLGAEQATREARIARQVDSELIDLRQISIATRRVVAQVIAATLRSDEISDEDIGIYVGGTREDLVRANERWASEDTMPLNSAHDIWLVVVNAAMLKPWRRWVPDLPPAAQIEAAMQELERPIHGRMIELDRDR